MYFVTYDIIFSIHSQNLKLKFNAYTEKQKEKYHQRVDWMELLRE
jgi:hypothetical protein